MAFYEHVLHRLAGHLAGPGGILERGAQGLPHREPGRSRCQDRVLGAWRNLTYRIRKNRKGHHYSLLAIDAPAPAVKEMERQLSLNEDVLRYLTLRVDELDPELSPVPRPARPRTRAPFRR